VLVDLVGKGGRIRSVPMPGFAMGAWTVAVGITDGLVFRGMNNKGQLAGGSLLPQNVMDAVIRSG
jgi:hypothetical protein